MLHTLFRKYCVRFIAIVPIIVLYRLSQLPAATGEERNAMAARFHFATSPLPTLPGRVQKSIRNVNPSLNHISGWISSVGASVALSDLDGDGLPNDVCYVDPRTDEVIVAPVPGTPARYKPFALTPEPLPYDRKTMAPMGCVPGDFNEDGLTDILVYYWGRPPILFLRRSIPSGHGPVPLTRPEYVPQELVTNGERWYTNAVTQADLDSDGHIDLVVGNYFPDGARILDASATNPETVQDTMSRAFNGGGKHFLLWQGGTAGASPTAHFKEVDSGLDDETLHGWTLALAAGDLDGDLLPELYLANDFGPDRLLHNRSTPGHLHFVSLKGRKRFTTPNSKVVGNDSFKGMGVDFGDLNGEGQYDIMVSNIAANYALEESNFLFMHTGETALMKQGVAPYEDRSEALGLSRGGWTWDAKFADFDNSGALDVIQAAGFVQGTINRWPELHELAMGNDDLLRRSSSWPRVQQGDDLCGHQHNPFFVRAADGRYYDISHEIGMDETHVTRGIAIADVDGDGRLDFAIANQWETSVFYHNESPNPGAFLCLHLLLPVHGEPPSEFSVQPGHPTPDHPGRPAIGATVTVSLPGGRRAMAQVDGGNGHSGRRSPELHFGLGRLAAEARLNVALRWRDTTGQVHSKTVELSPGCHTLLLGSATGKGTRL